MINLDIPPGTTLDGVLLIKAHAGLNSKIKAGLILTISAIAKSWSDGQLGDPEQGIPPIVALSSRLAKNDSLLYNVSTIIHNEAIARGYFTCNQSTFELPQDADEIVMLLISDLLDEPLLINLLA